MQEKKRKETMEEKVQEVIIKQCEYILTLIEECQMIGASVEMECVHKNIQALAELIKVSHENC